MLRDVAASDAPRTTNVRTGKSVIAVIGIDDYASWPRLTNAVNDATGIHALFTQLEFAEVTEPLLDGAATGEAMRRLVTDDLARLSENDSLVLFFAGHGHTQAFNIGVASGKTGYVIPVDADAPGGSVSSWVRLDGWLSDVARLPPRHILVIIDACCSGIALGALIKWRYTTPHMGAIDELRARPSRRIITSALDDQRAMDGGPYPRHSLFTGCLIEGISGGLADGRRQTATGSELGLYVQRRVRTYPQSIQTPDFGALELDDRGEIVIPLLIPQPLLTMQGQPPTTTEFPAPAPAGAYVDLCAQSSEAVPKSHNRTRTAAMIGAISLIGGLIYLEKVPPHSHALDPEACVLIVPDAEAVAMMPPQSSPFTVSVDGQVIQLSTEGILIGSTKVIPEVLRENYRKFVPIGEPSRYHVEYTTQIAESIIVNYDGRTCTRHILNNTEVTLWVLKFSECI